MEVRFLSGVLIMNTSSLVNFLFEASALTRLKRTGWQILGENNETIAGHTFMVCVISYILAVLLKADTEKTLLIALFHDFEEARTGDVYKLADLYTQVDRKKALRDAFSNLPQSAKIQKLLEDYQKKQSLEAKIVRDADTLSLCFELKQLVERGNSNAVEWLQANIGALKTSEGKKLGRQLLKSNSQNWWKKERKILHQLMKNK